MVRCTRGVVCAERTLEATSLSHSPAGMLAAPISGEAVFEVLAA